MAKEPIKITVSSMDVRTTKMRIKLFNPMDGDMISDRLVEQSTEMRVGPKEPHKGPLSLEFNLYTQEDVDAMLTYIKKLKGDLPIDAKVPKTKKDKQLNDMLSDKEPLIDLVKTVKAKAKDQESLMETLRVDYNFKFLASDVVKEFSQENPEQITIKDKHEEYQWMVRLIKEAKNPANDKYDWRLVFGIKILGDKVDKVQVYQWGKYDTTWKLAWAKPKEFNFKKVNPIYIFPEPMTIEERKKWRAENRKVAKDEKYEQSKFYKRWKPYIKVHGG